MRVVSVSSSRADVGILAPVWQALAAYDDADLHLFLTGMHRAENAPPVEGIPEQATVHKGGADLGGETGRRAAESMATITRSAGKLYAAVCPDAILVMGDRMDMLPAAVASLPFNIPLVHLHGGEVTEGAVDDRIRHALSKLAHWHCVSSEGAKARLLAMGEIEDRITVTGAPGLDTLLAAPELNKGDFLRRVGLPADADFRIVTVHPETNSSDVLAPLGAVLEALEQRVKPTIFTAPNSDPGGAEMHDRLDIFVAKNSWAVVQDTLGAALYSNAMRHADLMLGNSSSGIIEAGLFGLPVINVGDRQKGRERGENIIDVPNDAKAVIAALDRLGPTPARCIPGTPYGAGAAGPRVALAILSLPAPALLLAKPSPASAATGA
ncbi:MAG TPA: UDP-N-acetylglucosamine 2-epimerase [Methyloceanibacter sp.]|nr:UDP-N-acetylglucosamine 2-epimerase [Methyloceanibacter sp.]